MFEYQYAYLIGNLFFLVVWVVFFISRKDLRAEILLMSLLVAPLGASQYFYLRDYWQPEYFGNTFFGIFGFEDILFSFLIGGIAAVIYEEVFGKRHSKRHLKQHTLLMFGFSVVGVIWVFVGTILLDINSIYVTSALPVLVGIIIIVLRHDLLKDALWSGLLTGTLMFLFYFLFFNPLYPDILQDLWMLENVSGIMIVGVPIEEIMWAFSFGFVAGPTYEFFRGVLDKKDA